MSHEIAIMRAGLVVEQGSAEEIFERPRGEYTKMLLAAALELSTGASPA